MANRRSICPQSDYSVVHLFADTAIGKKGAVVFYPMYLSRVCSRQQTSEEIANLKAIEKKLGELKLTVKRKLGANGSLFGAVTKEEIAHELKEQFSIEIDKKTIEIEHAIKTTGNFDVSIKLGHGIHATLALIILGE